MKLEKFLYFDTKPTNVCWNGTSFPIHPKDIIKCHADFAAAFLDAKYHKKIPDDDPREVKFTFPASPTFLTPDPMKGLPVRSDPTVGPRLKSKMRPVPLLGEELEDNPYDLGVEKAVIAEEPTVVATTSLPKDPPPSLKTLVEAAKDEEEVVSSGADEEEETVVDIDLPDPPDEEDVQVDPPERDQGPDIPMKSALRLQGRDDIYNRMVAVRAAGCPLNPDMLDSFKEFKPKATRGLMFKALWKYYGFDG